MRGTAVTAAGRQKTVRFAKSVLDLDDRFHWTGWRRRHWPADEVKPGLRFYAFDKKSRRFRAILQVTKGRSFSYKTKADFARSVDKATGEPPWRHDPHWKVLPHARPGRECVGIAFRWKIVRRIDKGFAGRFPRLGWLTLSSDLPSAWPADLEEGGAELRRHIRTEQRRSQRARSVALTYWEARLGRIQCLACGFDFERRYGDIGRGVIEMHHERPISQAKGRRKVAPKDLKPLCSNCHRIVHRLIAAKDGRIVTPDMLKSQLRR